MTEWFAVRFDSEVIYVQASPPGGKAWSEEIYWKHIIRICFKAADLFDSDEIYIFTTQRPESYLIPVEASGGSDLWGEILTRKLFDAELAIKASMANNELFCWPSEVKEKPASKHPLYSPNQLPDLEGDPLILTWDQIDADSLILHGDKVVWREWTGWEVFERFEEIALVLKSKYGKRLVDLVPTPRSHYALFGDRFRASGHVEAARKALATEPVVEEFTWSELERAIQDSNSNIIQRYLAQGGEPNLQSSTGNSLSLLGIAKRYDKTYIAQMLLAAGAKPGAMDTPGDSPTNRGEDPVTGSSQND